MTDIEQRPNFYEGQYLDAADLEAVVTYSAAQLSRHELGGHRWGIALGLDLHEVPGPNSTLDVFVQPGYAWDGFGRAVVVAEPAKLSGALFAAIDAEFVAGNPPRIVEVWLRYDEQLTRGPRPGFEDCGGAAMFARVNESYRVEVGRRPQIADRRDPVEIAGRVTDAVQALRAFDPATFELVDTTVPHQTFPDDPTARWLIPVGVVNWTPGNPGHLEARSPAEIELSARSRQYCGVVAGSVEAVGGHVRVHDRSLPYSTGVTDELMWVEGALRVDGDTRIYGHRLELVRSHAENPRVPFHVARVDDVATKKMQLVIGDAAAGANRLAVGPKTGVDATGADTHAEHLVVTDQARVGIGTSVPKAPLHIPADGVEIGTSGVPTDNFFVQSNTDGPRGLRVYSGDIGAGAHLLSITQTGRLGVGATDPTNVVEVKGSLGVRQNAMYLSGDSLWSSLTFNAHHNAANNAWVFPDQSKPAVTVEMDALNGNPRFEVYSTLVNATSNWVSRLFVGGNSGDVGMAANGGRVGVGTYAPAAKLDVRGDIKFGVNGTSSPVAAPIPVRTIWGTVSGGGGKLNGEGFTVARLGAGRYKVTFDVAFPSPPTVVVTKVFMDVTLDAGTNVKPRENAVLDQVLADTALIATANDAGTLADSTFCFIALGPG